MTVRTVLIPFRRVEAAEITVAARVAGVSVSTMRRWCDVHGVGRKVGGRYLVSRPALAMHLDGAADTLATYHDGNRTDAVVRLYFERVGCVAALA